MNADIENLIAKDQISDLNSRYCRALDWLDEEALHAIFWPDAPIDYGFFQGSAEAFVPIVIAMEKRAARRWHTTLNLPWIHRAKTCGGSVLWRQIFG